MNRQEAAALAVRILADAPSATTTIENDLEPDQYFVDVIYTLRFVVRDAEQWERRKGELEKFKKEK